MDRVVDEAEESVARAASEALVPVLQALVALGAEWGHRRPIDPEEVADLRRRALLLNHYRYVETVASYRRIAERRNLVLVDGVEDVIDELAVTADLFKSYDPRWLTDLDLGALTGWLADRFTGPLPAPPAGLDGLDAWRAWLRSEGVFVAMSSGTSGRPSFIPKDRFTSAAQRNNAHYFSHPAWDPGPAAGEYDCLVLTPPGVTLGMQAAATGLAAGAVRSHHLDAVPLGPDALVGTGRGDSGARSSWPEMADAAAGFLEESVRLGRRILVFGPPAVLATLCLHLDEAGRSVPLPDGSAVLTGGGWKGAPGSIGQVRALVSDVLDVGPGAQIDAYSASEFTFPLVTCPEGRYHVPPSVEVAVLDGALRRQHGTDLTGILAFLDPFAVSYPGFVVTDDTGRVVDGACPCGLDGPAIVGAIERRPGAEIRGCGGVISAALA